jgi:two-component system sensor histidine kinase/response regulator
MAQPETQMLADVSAESLDVSALDALKEIGDDDFVRELVDDFASSMDEYLPVLREAALGGDADTVYRTAHTIKSSSASMGAMRVSEMAARIEQAGRGGALAGVPEAIQAMSEAVTDTLGRLRDATA